MAFTDGKIVIGTSVDVGGINTGLAKIQKSFNRLGKMATLVLGTGVFIKLGKDALDAASDLQEVQNVVDVAFEDMAYKAEAFASTAIEQFGMSEFAAKQTASSFMAMGKSMGLSLEEASNMAIRLSQLTGDFASFYNISQEYAKVAMSAVYTGETETLKRYGIVLTEANLQEFASSKGIEKKVKAMGAREKALIRYAYVLEATKDMEGDFVRTQNSWANETRVLSQKWNQFLIVLGNGLITVLTPILDILSSLITRTIQFSRLLGVIISNIFGIQFQSIVDENEKLKKSNDDLTVSEENFSDSIKDSTKAVKKYLAPFDELNVMKKDSTSDVGSGIDFDSLDLGLDLVIDLDKKVEELTSDIDNLFDLGRMIGDKISAALGSIDWDKVYNKFAGFGKGLAEFLNGLISTDLFKSVGINIARSLNSALKAALSFGMEFNWAQLGLKIAESINGFFANFNFADFANTIDAFVQGLFTTLKTVLDNIDWKLVFAGVKEFFSNLSVKTVAILIGFWALKKIIAASILNNFVAGITEGLGIIPLRTLFLGFGKSLGSAITSSLESNAVVKAVKFGATNIVQMISSTFRAGVGALLQKKASTSALTFIAPVVKAFTAIPTIIGGTILAVSKFFKMWEDGWDILSTILEALGVALVAVGAVILGAPAAIAAAVAGIVFAISQIAVIIHDNWDAIGPWLANLGTWIYDNVITPVVEFFKEAWENIVEIFSNVVSWIKTNIVEPVLDVVSNFVDKVVGTVSNIVGKVVGFFKNLGKTIYGFIEPIIGFVVGVAERISKIFEGIIIIFKALWITISNWFMDSVVTPIVNAFIFLHGVITTALNKLWTDIKAVWSVVKEFFNVYVVTPIITFFKVLWETVSTLFKTLWEFIRPIWEAVAGFFETYVIEPIVSLFQKLYDIVVLWMSSLWENIKLIWVVVETWFKTFVITPLETAWENFKNNISTIFTTLWDGVKSGAKAAINGIISGIEKGINGIIDILNTFFSLFNAGVQFAASITGDKWAGIELIPHVNIPRLAKGAVIPPNQEFMAILGDQKRGTNIEAPLDTIKQAVAEELAEQIEAMMAGFQAVVDAINNKDTDVYIGDSAIGKAAERYTKKQSLVRGRG